MKKRIVFKQLVCFISCLALILGQATGIALAEETNETIIAASVAVKPDAPFYLKGGKQVTYSGATGYYPEMKNGEMMIPVTMLSSVLSFTYSYDTKKETAVIKKDGKSISIRAGEDGIYINGTAKYINNFAENTDKEFIVPFKTVAQALGLSIIMLDGNITVATSKKETDFTDSIKSEIIRSMIDESKVIYSDNFEGSQWTYSKWNGGEAESSSEMESGRDGNGKCGYLSSTQNGFVGMLSKKISYDKSKQYKLTVDLKTTSNFDNTKLSIGMWPYDSRGVFLGGIGFTNMTGDITSEWKTYTFLFTKYSTRQRTFDDLTDFNINIMNTKTGSENASGGVYFDNLVLEEYNSGEDFVSCDIVADKFAAWYYIGDTVTFKTDNSKALESYPNIRAEIYNGDNELVLKQEFATSKIINSGWSYKPENLGYYEVKFTALAKDGTERSIAKSYASYQTDNTGARHLINYSDSTYSFAVVKGASKPMEERNDTLMASLDPYAANDTEMRLLDMIGISGLRLHALKWGSGYGASGGIEDKPGEFNFERADVWLKGAEKYGFKNIVANVFGTPEWAVEEKWRGTDAISSFGYVYSKMGPEKMEDLSEFIKEFYNHYKDKVDILEFWNEPHYGNTAFWADTPQKLNDMTKTAYKALREVDPDKNMLMSAHAWNQGYQLYRELIADKEYYNSFDMLSYHSRNGGDLKKYRAADESFGYESKPAFSSEEYLYALYTKGVPKDHRLSSMHFMSCFFDHIKNDVKFTTLFEVTDNVPDEVRVYNTSNNINTSHVMGLFSPFPYVEPHKGAVVAYNWYNRMGKDFTYNGEYDLGDGQKAVSFLNDGEPLVVVWNSQDKSFYLSDTLKNALGANPEMADFEGRSIDLNSQLKPLTMYYITGFDIEKLSSIEKKEGTAVNDEFESPFYTCKLPEFMAVEATALDESKVNVIIDNPKEKPFDEKTFKLSENIEWVTDNWNFVKENHSKPAGYEARFSAYLDKDGFYLLVDTTDSTIYDPTDGGMEWETLMYQCDSMQFAFDCLGTGEATKRAEFQVGNYKGNATLFKHAAPDVEFNMLEGWHAGNTVLDSKCVRIEKTGKGLMYKVFIPMSEMYPFQYGADTDHLRFSLLVNNNDGNGRSYYEWTSGIGGSKDPKLFGALRVK